VYVTNRSVLLRRTAHSPSLRQSTSQAGALSEPEEYEMRPPSPVVTLAVGAVTAAALLVVSSMASNAAAGDPPSPAAASSVTVTATPSATASVDPAPSAPAPVRTYAARVDGGGASVAIAVQGSEAIAYLCDGRTLEAWLWGTVTGGELLLRGNPDSAENSLLVGRLANGKVSGAVLHDDLRLTFAATKVTSPSGLYRATQQVGGARVVAGWVVLSDGTEIVAQLADPTHPASVTR
jgi:hypothetical protein